LSIGKVTMLANLKMPLKSCMKPTYDSQPNPRSIIMEFVC
jgi:hypothetical protein